MGRAAVSITDHNICSHVRRGELPTDAASVDRAEYRGLLTYTRYGALRLTPKGVALLDGIQPTACSGAHMGGPGRDWRKTWRTA